MNKKGVVWQELFPWVVGVLILLIIFVFYLFISGKLSGFIEYIKNWFRFGR